MANRLTSAPPIEMPPPPGEEPTKLIDLTGKLEKSECFCRNEDPRFPHTNLFIGDSRLGCKSEADEQLILHVAFQENVKIKSIKFTAFNDGTEPELNPTTVKMYVNRNNLGFEDIDDVDPTQIIELTTEDLREGSDPIATKFVKFQRVGSITFYIEENNGGEISALGGLKIMGKGTESMDMTQFKKQPDG
ncbi:MAG: hypothetical protein SGBAC_003508 [Bacillariaceae sp.]